MNKYNDSYGDPMIASFSLRDMVHADLPQVVEIEQQSHLHPWTRSLFERELENSVSRLIVCEAAGEIVGYLCVWEVAGDVEIHNVATVCHWQRRGVGAYLLKSLLSDLIARQISAVFLEVRRSNVAAIALYEKFGFHVSNCRRGYYHDGEDALLMSCPLVCPDRDLPD